MTLDHSPAPQRTGGSGQLSAKSLNGVTRLDRLYQDGAARIRLPRVVGAAPLEAVLINTAGGLTGGDHMTWHIEAGSDAQLSLTTQACEKIYRAEGESVACVDLRLRLRARSSLAWLPQETILFDRARLHRQIEVDMADDARLLLVEPAMFGRLAMKETVNHGLFRDQWRIRVGERLLHAEATRLGPDIAATLERAASAHGRWAMATAVLIGSDSEARCGPARDLVGKAGAVSYFPSHGSQPGKLLARLVARDSYELRKPLGRLIRLLNPEGGLPKVWTM